MNAVKGTRQRLAVLLVLALLAVASGGCASVRADVRYVDRVEATRHVDRIVPGSRSYTASADVIGEYLVVTLLRDDACESVEIRLVRRHRITSLTASAADASDSMHLQDTIDDLGVHEDSSIVGTHRCNRGPAGREPVELELDVPGRVTRLPSITSSVGHARFAMQSVSAEALAPDAQIRIRTREAYIDLRLVDDQRLRLVAALQADPASRMSQDIAHRQKSRVDDVLAALDGDDIALARQIVTDHPETRAPLSRDARVERILRKVASDAAFVILSGKTNVEAAPRLCATQFLFTYLFGKVTWDALTHDFAVRFSRTLGGTVVAATRRLEPICS